MLRSIVDALKFKKGKQPESPSDLQTALLIFAFLLLIFSLTFTGRFTSDDEHLLASRTLSLAFDKNLGDKRVYGNSRLYALTNTSQPYAAQAANIEPGQMIIGAWFARMGELLGLGKVQALFLVNIWATAFTGLILFIVVRQFGYTRRTAVWIALLFGIGTMAWPYSQTYFRDTVAMMLLAIAWAGAVVISQNIISQKTRPNSFMVWLLMIASLFAGILTKNTIVIAVPVLLGYIVYVRMRQGLAIVPLHLLKFKQTIMLTVAGALMIIFWVAFLSPTGIFARHSLEYYQLLTQKFLFSPHPHFLEALFGPLISSGKSIFLFSPILVISLIGLFRHTKITWPAWVYLGLLILGQALFYDGEWGGGEHQLGPPLQLTRHSTTPDRCCTCRG